MTRIRPVPAIGYPVPDDRDLSAVIAPPYDVLDAESKARLLDRDPHNIVAVDLPHLPPKTVGPDATYEAAGDRFESWLEEGVLAARSQPAFFIYQQVFEADGQAYTRRGLIANVEVQPFGDHPSGQGGIYPHEQTFSSPKEDRLKLMRTTGSQLSPIFGIYSDAGGAVADRLEAAVAGRDPDCFARTDHDGVRHEAWAVDSPEMIEDLSTALEAAKVFIADGHHRYTTALNYLEEAADAAGGTLPADHPARGCMFVLIALEDPGMIVRPTHRVLGGMNGFSIAALREAAGGQLVLEPFAGDDLVALEAALGDRGPHAMGLVAPSDPDGDLWIATTAEADPLADRFPDRSEAWRGLDVAVVQHLLVEAICEPAFAGDGEINWKFPHDLEAVRDIASGPDFDLGVVLQPPSLGSVQAVSEAGELMPQKSTFFYPKLATGLAINSVGDRRPAAG